MITVICTLIVTAILLRLIHRTQRWFQNRCWCGSGTRVVAHYMCPSQDSHFAPELNRMDTFTFRRCRRWGHLIPKSDTRNVSWIALKWKRCFKSHQFHLTTRIEKLFLEAGWSLPGRPICRVHARRSGKVIRLPPGGTLGARRVVREVSFIGGHRYVRRSFK